MSINQRIRLTLAEQRLNQSDLARKMDVGQTAISNQLRGKDTDSIKLIVAISKLTNTTVGWLITGEEPRFQKSGFEKAVEAGLTDYDDYSETLKEENKHLKARLDALEDAVFEKKDISIQDK